MKLLNTMLLIVLLATPASAQEQSAKPSGSGLILPSMVLLAGNTADLWTTVDALHTDYLHEGNPFNSRNNLKPIIINKLIGTAVIAASMVALNHLGHPKVAKALGYLDGGVTLGVAAHNASLIRKGR